MIILEGRVKISYIPGHLPNHIERDMKYLNEIGCTEILFALQENHIKTLTGALRFGAKIAKDNGLKPYAVVWGYANTFGGGRMSNILFYSLYTWSFRGGLGTDEECERPKEAWNSVVKLYRELSNKEDILNFTN